MNLRIKRIYEQPLPADGKRVLVDGIWPRGISKTKAQIDLWLREISPTAELRKWFNHRPERWPSFRRRYIAEMAENGEAVNSLLDMLRGGTVTLLYSARSEHQNQAIVIRDYICQIAGDEMNQM